MTVNVGRRPRRCTIHKQHGKGCETCRARARWYWRYREAQIAAGEWDADVSVDEVIPHLVMLFRAGMNDEQVGSRAGLNPGTVATIRNRHREVVTAATAQALLGVELLPPRERLGYIPTIGTSRRLDAMSRAGWSQLDVAEALGRPESCVRGWGRVRSTLLAADAAAMAELFDARVREPGPSRLAAQRAARRGRLPWYAWTPDDIDDQAADPHGPVPAFAARRRLRALATVGWSPYDVAKRYDALDPDVLDRLMRVSSKTRRDKMIPRWIHTAVSHAYDALSDDLDGPSPELAVQARDELRWPTPMAWHGIDIEDDRAYATIGAVRDEPVPQWSGNSITLALSGHLTYDALNAVERAVTVLVLRAQDWNDARIAAWLRWPGSDPVEALKRTLAPSHRVAIPLDLALEVGLWAEVTRGLVFAMLVDAGLAGWPAVMRRAVCETFGRAVRWRWVPDRRKLPRAGIGQTGTDRT